MTLDRVAYFPLVSRRRRLNEGVVSRLSQAGSGGAAPSGVWGGAPAGSGAAPQRGAGQRPAGAWGGAPAALRSFEVDEDENCH